MIEFYQKIDSWLKEHENYKPVKTKSLSDIADYIDWAWRWRKITEAQKDNVCNRICELFERGDY